MAVQFSVFCGTDAPNLTPDQCEELARNLAAEYFPAGHSVRIEDGCWKMQTGDVVKERTVVITWLTESDALTNAKVGKLAHQFKNEAQQEAVLVIRQEVDSFFI